MEDTNNTFNYLSQDNNARALYLLGDSSLRDVTSYLLSEIVIYIYLNINIFKGYLIYS